MELRNSFDGSRSRCARVCRHAKRGDKPEPQLDSAAYGPPLT
jgi:hypothetical protein